MMNIRKLLLAVPFVALFSSAGYAATELDKSCGDKLATISLSRNVVSPDDAKSQVDAIAEQRGASHYRINSLVAPGGNGGNLRVSADLFRC
jgi:hypothetical protein